MTNDKAVLVVSLTTIFYTLKTYKFREYRYVCILYPDIPYKRVSKFFFFILLGKSAKIQNLKLNNI